MSLRRAACLLLACVMCCHVLGAHAAPSLRKPLRGVKAQASGSAPRHDPVLRLGGAQIDLEALRDEALEDLKAQITQAIEAQAEEVKTAFGDAASAPAQEIYKDFLYWLNERVRVKLLRQYPNLKGEAALDEKYAEWLESPDQELGHYVDLYLQERAPGVKWLLDAYRDEASWEIASGLQEIFEDAQGKLERFTQVVGDADRDPNAPTSELLRKHGLSGDWIDRFEAHEDRFRTFDDRYKFVEATQLVVNAFQTRVPREKIDRLTDLMSLLGGAAEDSNVPVVSLFGQVVKAYGDMAREVLAQLDRLSKRLRERAGYCVGVGATGDDRHRAFVRQFGSRDQACPTRLKDVYERTLPADGRIYFFVDGRFLAGREDNGEFPAVLQARSLLHAAAGQSDPTFRGRENDLAALAEVYNVAYKTRYGTGVPGLMREAEETLAGIAKRQHELERGLEAPCGLQALQRALERETGLRSGDGVEPVAGNEQRLAVRYAVGYLRGGGAHATYSRIWAALKELSLLQVSGQVVSQAGGACAECGRAAMQVAPTALQQLPGCEVTHADASGRFVFHALTRSTDFRLALSASNAGRRSTSVDVTRFVVGIERVPFVKAFPGVRLELPAAPATAAAPTPPPPTDRPATPSPGAVPGGATEGIDTSCGAGCTGRDPALPEPQLAAPSPSASVPALPTARAVPDLAGLGPETASQRLASAGLVAALVGGDPAPRAELAYKVQGQHPEPGALVAPGASVSVRVHSAFDARRAVPNVVGLAAGDAEQRLRSAGFGVDMSGGDPAPRRDAEFTIQSQQPAGDSLVQAGGRVGLRVHSAFAEALPPPAPARSPAADGLVAATLAASNACQYGLAAQHLAQLGALDPGNAWLRGNAENVTRLAARERDTRIALENAQRSLAANDLGAAQGAIQQALVSAPPCLRPQVDALAQAIGQAVAVQAQAVEAERQRQRERARQAAAEALQGLVQTLGQARNPPPPAPAAPAPPPQNVPRPAATDSCAQQYRYPNKWASQPECTCASYRWNGAACVHDPKTGSAPKPAGFGGFPSPSPAPSAAAPPPRPAPPPAPASSGPGESRPACYCSDATGHYRMPFGQECDPQSSSKDYNCWH